ncbi:FAD-dependent monooxygenase [Zavarzinella formosa]|uniref:FAD-dependent monooxygenase n=1 Tax=Zavarzinella formosa TaxID=360055 RepID=UPI0003010C1B|nr:FAD-dependent monooxygenase [Zavarzinella formosa]
MIAGGGIAGLALAHACRNRGIPAVVVERAPVLREVGSAILLGMNAYRVLQELGISAVVESHAVEVEQAELRDWRGRLLISIPLGRLSREWGLKTLVCRRSTLQMALASGLSPDQLLLGWEVRCLRNLSRHVVVENTNREILTTDLVAGCDGIRGVCRQYVTSDTEPIYSGSICWRGIVATDDTSFVPVHTMVERLGPGMRFGVAWNESGRLGWYLTKTGPAGGHDERHNLPERLASLVGDWQPEVGRVIASTPADAILRTDLMDLSTPRRLHRGGIMLLGDAAHAMLPNLGQGGASALEDATNLARHLAEAPNRETALIWHEQDRWRRVRFKQFLSRGYGIFNQRPERWQCSVRDFVLRCLPNGITGRAYRHWVAGSEITFRGR